MLWRAHSGGFIADLYHFINLYKNKEMAHQGKNSATWFLLRQSWTHLSSCGKQQHNQTQPNHIQMMRICLMFYGESLMRPAEGKFVEIKSPWQSSTRVKKQSEVRALGFNKNSMICHRPSVFTLVNGALWDLLLAFIWFLLKPTKDNLWPVIHYDSRKL